MLNSDLCKYLIIQRFKNYLPCCANITKDIRFRLAESRTPSTTSVHLCTFTRAHTVYPCRVYLAVPEADCHYRAKARPSTAKSAKKRRDDARSIASYWEDEESRKGGKVWRRWSVADIGNRFSRNRPAGFTCSGRRAFNTNASLRSRTFIRYTPDRLIYRHGRVSRSFRRWRSAHTPSHSCARGNQPVNAREFLSCFARGRACNSFISFVADNRCATLASLCEKFGGKNISPPVCARALSQQTKKKKRGTRIIRKERERVKLFPRRLARARVYG